MKKFKISKEHADTLKEYGYYDAFMRNIQNDSFNGNPEGYDPTEPLSDEVVGAFDWSQTPEGHDYWRKICIKLEEAGL